MSFEIPIINRRFGRFRVLSVDQDPEQNKWARILDDSGREYLGKLTRLDASNGIRDSFNAEEKVFESLTNGEMPSADRLVGLTPFGFPNVHFLGRHRNEQGHEYGFIVIDMHESFQASIPGRLRTIQYMELACAMLKSIQTLHRHGFVHRNLKPQNLRRRADGSPVLVDFTRSKRFIYPITGYHIPEKQESSFHGSPLYSSVHALRKRTQSRRDDLISLGYSLIKMIRGHLPWEERPSSRSCEEERTTLIHMRQVISLNSLCHGLPSGIYSYMRNVTDLTYYETPNYEQLIAFLTS